MHKRHDVQRQHIIDSVCVPTRPLRRLLLTPVMTSSTTSYSSSTPSPSSYRQPSFPCCVESPASSCFTSLESLIPNCPCASGSSFSSFRMYPVSGHTSVMARQRVGPSSLTSLGWVCVSTPVRRSAHARTGYLPSKLQLVLLDALILCLQMLLTTISFEISHRSSFLSDPETSAIPPSPTLSSPPTPTLEIDCDDGDDRKHSHNHAPTMIVDLRFRHLINRLRNPVPLVSRMDLNTLPLPNTTPTPLYVHLRAIVRRREEARRRVAELSDTAETANSARTADTGSMPGSMSTEQNE